MISDFESTFRLIAARAKPRVHADAPKPRTCVHWEHEIGKLPRTWFTYVELAQRMGIHVQSARNASHRYRSLFEYRRVGKGRLLEMRRK